MQPQFNPMQVIQAIMQGQNPQQMVMSILEEKMGQTPMGQNLLSLAKMNDVQGIEQIARNMTAQRGVNYDQAFSAFKNQMGIK